MPDSNSARADRPALSVVVMGYRNEDTIVSAVASALGQPAPEPFEVVVVTSGGDASAARVREAFPDLALFESSDRLLPGGARNAGVRMARGAIVAFLAADCLAEPGWVAARLRAHRAGHRAVAAAMTNADPQRPWSWAALFLSYHDRLPGRAAGPVTAPDPAAHGISFDRDLLDAVGPFDETRRIGEDTDMARALAARGVEVWFEPAVRIAHRGPGSTRALLVDFHRRGARFVLENGLAPPGGGTWPAILRAEARLFRRRLGLVLQGSRRHVPPEWRSRLLWAAPWIVGGLLALRTGRVRAFRVVRRRAARGDREA